MQQLLASIAEKKARLDRARPASEAALLALRPHYDVELEIPDLMREFGAWLAEAPPAAEAAFEAHSRLTAILTCC